MDDQKASLDPFDVANPVVIEIAKTAKEARSWLRKGYCPIECSFGDESVVCKLEMDHHGSFSHLEGVAIRAYRDHFGKRSDKPKFVVTGTPDEDACFAIAALAGKLPHPCFAELFEDDSSLKHIWSQNFIHVAELINQADTNPKDVDLMSDYWGRLIVYWRALTNITIRDTTAFHAGVARWRDILTTPQDKLISVVPDIVETTLQSVRAAPFESISKKVTVIDCSAWGFSHTYATEWYTHSPLILAFYGGINGKGFITFSVKDKTAAEKMFGTGGLLAIYDKLEESGFDGCGGREDIGGSNRHVPLSWAEALELGKAFDALVLPPAQKQKAKQKATKKNGSSGSNNGGKDGKPSEKKKEKDEKK